MYLAARNEDRAKAAIEDLKQTTGKEAIFLKLDLSSLGSVKAAAEEFLRWVHSSPQRITSGSFFRRKEPALHILFNNACVSLPLARAGLSQPSSAAVLWRDRLDGLRPTGMT